MWIIILLIILFIALITFVIIESSGFKKVYYNISSEDYNGNPVKICFMADLHNKVFGNNNSPLLEAIDEYNPDIVILGGDMITSGWDVSFDYSSTVDFIGKLSSQYPVYYAPGNHEEKFDRDRKKFPKEYSDFINKINEMGIVFLDNEDAVVDKFGLHIYGLKLPHKYFKKFRKLKLEENFLVNTLGTADDNNFSVLIAHNPEYFPDYSEWGAKMVLSGHVHGGIISLPGIGGVISPGIKLFPKYDAGLFYENDSLMVLTRGIGSHGIPIRVWNKAEIVCITLEGAEGECDES